LSPRLELEDRDKVRRVDERFIFGPIVSAKSAFVGPRTERINQLLYSWIDPKLDQTPRNGPLVQAAAEWV
jgi:hypothetical protein